MVMRLTDNLYRKDEDTYTEQLRFIIEANILMNGKRKMPIELMENLPEWEQEFLR